MSNIVHIFLGELSYLEKTMYVECDAGFISIDLTKNKEYSIENELFPGMRKTFSNKSDVADFVGEVEKITMYDHETKREKRIY